MKVRLNLSTKPLDTHRRFLAGSSITAVIAGFVFLGLGWHVYSARKVNAEQRVRTEIMRQEMAKLEVQRKDLERYFNQKEIAELHDRAAFINTILDARSFNWTLMFMDLERILPGGVRVISVEPKQVGGHVEVKLTVGASSDENELKFIKALEDSKEFSEVQVTSVHRPNSVTSGDQEVVQLTTAYSRS